MNDTPVYLEVPQPLYNADAELNLMAMLEYIMRTQAEVTTETERQRVVKWFADRYGEDSHINSRMTTGGSV